MSIKRVGYIDGRRISGRVSIAIPNLPAGNAYSGLRMVVTATNPENGRGIAAWLASTITGVQVTNFASSVGSWIFMQGLNTTGASNPHIYAQGNGIREGQMGTDVDVAGNTLTGAHLIFGLRMEKIISAATNGVTHTYPFSINTNNMAITALFSCMTATDLGVIAGAGVDMTSLLPIFRDSDGNMRYARLYSE